ncbi:uncharacterized protein prob1 [Danio aesculapii]|uniref:uncharacterized protein prob1 n=1 Tax=Danio aesculapii TaxID=1142201 RepID=UPI0024BFB584|nr:uncharacterized protein prob1 [Danio aesculapii]
MYKSSPSVREKDSLPFQERDEEEGDLEQTDDITDDSASSYYTAFCSLSEYSDALEDRTHTERPTEGDSFKLSDCSISVHGITSTSLIKATTLFQDCKTEEYKCMEVLPDVSQCEQDQSLSASETLVLESKHLLLCTTITNVNLQSVNTNTLQSQDHSDELNTSETDSSVKLGDSFGGSRTVFHTNIRTTEEPCSPEPGFTSNTILITPDRNQYSKGREQEYGGKEPKEDHATQKQRPRDGLSAPSAECRLKRGGHILGHMEEEGEGRVVSCRKDQPELSVRSRNRNASANSILTLTASKQESRIPPHCYSERIPATRHQHQLQSLADTRRLEKQSRQGVWQSRPFSRTLSSSSCQTSLITDSTSGSTTMGTKLAEASSEVGGFVNLAQVRSSCSETDYMHVFGSSCRPASQSDGNHNKWTEDVLAFKMQMYSKTQNTSAGSESSSFECVDVALETTDKVNRGLKTVPKRQIQLKRRDTVEAQFRENNNQTHEVVNTHVHPRDIFQRQHSTPAVLNQDPHVADQRSVQAERKQKLQKSYSLDETSSKTQMASSIIANVLSKKMQHEQNLRTLDVSDKAFASTKVNIKTATTDECLYTSGKDVYAETTKPYQSATLKRETESNYVHCSFNSKPQPKLLSKHGLSPLLSGTGKSEVRGSGTEITDTSENEKAEKLNSREKALQLPNLSSGVKLSCDSAKGRTWNSSAATNVAISTQASVKTTPEECHTGQGIHKQHNMTQTNVLETQEEQAGSTESTLSPTNITCLISDLEANAVDNTTPKTDDCGIGKDQESDREDFKSSGQFSSLAMQSQGKLKAPVHIVRDMRSLVKNTYNKSFKGPRESTHIIEGSAALFQSSIHNLSNKNEAKGKGYKQDERPLLRKVTPPLPLERRRDHSAPRGCSAKVMPSVESNDKSHIIGFTKVSPISATKANSCALSKPSETQDSQVGISKSDVTVIDLNFKPTNRSDLAMQPREETSTDMTTKGELTRSSDKDHLFPALQYVSPTSSEQQDHGKIIGDGLQTPSLPPRSQSSVGPQLSACVLTVASTPMVPSYYYKPNVLGYQTISPHIGAVHGYVQGPVLFQTPLYNQTPAPNSHTPLLRFLSEDGKTLVQPTDGSTSQAQKEDTQLKIHSPETQHNTIFVAPMSAEARLDGAGVLYPEAGGSVAASTRQLLLDPETGRYFYVDMPQLPQRKMLFDPETCQYVEVLLPQQALPSAVVPTPCAIPFASLHIPPMYTPQCLPYIQSHHQVLPPPGP